MGTEGGKIVITGGSGFIMSHVAERLVETGREIVLFDDNEQHSLGEETKTLLARKTNLRFVQGDVRDKAAVEELLKDAEIVYHFAALMGTSSRFKEWEIPTVEVNVLGTIQVLQASLKAGVKYFIHPPRPPLAVWLTPYIISKTAQTLFTQMYHHVYDLPTVGLNIQNCYGPRERAILNPNPMRSHEGRKLVASSIMAALKNEPIIVFGDGEQSSDFIYIDDVVEACLKAPCESAVGQVLDIGTGISTPVIKVVESILELTRSRSKIEHLPLRTGEVPLRTKADPTPARQNLNWEPKTQLVEGLRKTIPYYANLLGVKSPV
ncbi:MAG: SDR family NAD(P)-dependent oxidoreductase [Deltaproteobacteria bacterium]|nr:SDR family NAD(P)-dependent oxidoreductase [Deltaproteobacteria bacterium]